MQNKIFSYLNSRRTDETKEASHLCYGNFNGCFKIDNNDEFIKIYIDAINNGVNISILEKQQEFAPILVDIDLKSNDNKRLYTSEMYNKIIDAYSESIKKYLKIKNTIWFLFEKKNTTPKKDSTYGDGFHIVFPHIITDSQTRHKIRDNSVELMKDDKSFKHFSEPLETIIDKAVVSTNGWFLYGSCKPNTNNPYYLTKTNDKKINLSKIKDDEIIKMFSLRQKYYSKENQLNKLEIIENEKKIKIEINNDGKITETQAEQIKYFVSILNDKRADNYSDWLNVGLALHNIDYGLLSLWIDFSKSSPKFKEGECEKLWMSFKDHSNPLTIGSLIYWAKQDDPEAYKIYAMNNKKTTFWNDLKKYSNNDWAEIYSNIHTNVYIFSKISGWYGYEGNNRLIKYPSVPDGLMNDMTNTLREFLINERNKLPVPMKKHEVKDYENKINLCNSYYKLLGTASYIKGAIGYLPEMIAVEDFENKIDNDINLIAFKDCLYDYSIKKFRQIEKSDYIIKSTGYKRPYSKPEIRKELNEIINSIFDSPETKRYYLESTAISLFRNDFETMYIHIGSGGNGKGLLSSLIENSLGDYAYSCESSFLTETGKKANYNNSLCDAQGVRYLLVTEPESTNINNEITLNIEMVKKIVGGDKVSTRRAFSKVNTIYKPQFTVFLQCNQLPTLNKPDGGIKRRLAKGVIDFPFEFVETVNNSKQRQRDITLKTKFKNQDYINEFMLLLIDTASNIQLVNNELVPPTSIIKASSEYIDNNDPIKSILPQITIKEKRSYIKLVDLKEAINIYTDSKYTTKQLKEFLKSNNIDVKPYNGRPSIKDYKLIEFEEETKNDLDL
jgi:hypothetical protein